MKKFLAILAIWAILITTSLQVATATQPPLCSQALHDSYVTTGPDGLTYPTWHPAIDPVSGCSFGHEHGSNPASFDATYRPAYGYTSHTAGFTEPHFGFKTYVFSDYNGHMWMITHHFGTNGVGRVCTRFHEFDVAMKDTASGELLGEWHFMGDFGAAVVNANTALAFAPADCPNQLQDAAGSTGIRMIPTADTGGIGYEPWRLDSKKAVNRFEGKDFTINTGNSQIICDTFRCGATGKRVPNQDWPFYNSGTRRFIIVYQGFGVRPAKGGDSGVFYTDAYGRNIVASTTPGALYNYISPNLDAGWTVPILIHQCWQQQYLAGGVYRCQNEGYRGDVIDMAFENAVSAGPN